MHGIDQSDYDGLLGAAIAEDIGRGDVTTSALIPADLTATAAVVARQDLMFCGSLVVERLFERLGGDVVVERRSDEGSSVASGETALTLTGSAAAILTGERIALNFLQRLSGIATSTARYVKAVENTGATILDTRKTTPGWRALEKYSVRCGGGTNHRSGLYDMIMIKDNHLAAIGAQRGEKLSEAVARVRRRHPGLRLEVEVDSLGQIEPAIGGGADIILLDNMSPVELRTAVELIAGRVKSEASGGIDLSTVRAIAETGVDYISIGALTHSAPSADLALDFDIRVGS